MRYLIMFMMTLCCIPMLTACGRSPEAGIKAGRNLISWVENLFRGEKAAPKTVPGGLAVSAGEGKGVFNAIRGGVRWVTRKITGKKVPKIPRGGAKSVVDLAADVNPYTTGGVYPESPIPGMAREEGGVAKFYKRVTHNLHTPEGRYAKAQDIARKEPDLSKIKIKPNSTGGVDITGVKPGGSPYFNSVPNPDAPKGVRSVVNGIARPVYQAVALPFTAPVSAVSNGLRIGADAIGWKGGARALRRFRNNVRRIGDGPSTGNVGWDKALPEVVKWYRKAAEQGDADAQSDLGNCYYNGEGAPKALSEAVRWWYHKSAEQGHAWAQFCTGECYANGDGVPKDLPEAVKWYRKAAEQGYALAQFCLGFCYYNGYGVPKDLTEAAKWFRKAAEQGYAPAQEALREMGQ